LPAGVSRSVLEAKQDGLTVLAVVIKMVSYVQAIVLIRRWREIGIAHKLQR